MLSEKKFHGIKEWQTWCTEGGTRESLEDYIWHTRMIWTVSQNPLLRDLPKSQNLMLIFNESRIKMREVWDFVHKARAGSALGMDGISHKLYENCLCVLRKLTVLLQQVWKKVIVPQEWCLADGIWIPKEMQSKGITNFRPISLLNVQGKYFGEFIGYTFFLVLK